MLTFNEKVPLKIRKRLLKERAGIPDNVILLEVIDNFPKSHTIYWQRSYGRTHPFKRGSVTWVQPYKWEVYKGSLTPERNRYKIDFPRSNFKRINLT